MNNIIPSPYQSREHFDLEDLRSLAESMKPGLIQPILVRPAIFPQSSHLATAEAAWRDRQRQSGGGEGQENADGVVYELIDGERRWRAAKLLGWTEIPAMVEELGDQEAVYKTCVANAQRKDLNPIEQAKSWQRLATAPFNLSQEEIAKVVGIKDRTVISRALALLDMPNELKDFVARATISPKHCRYIAQITHPEKQIAFARQVALEGWTVKETEHQVREILRRNGGQSKTKASIKRKPAAPAKNLAESGFYFSQEGEDVTIHVRYPRAGNWDDFLARLRAALSLWFSQNPHAPQPKPQARTEQHTNS